MAGMISVLQDSGGSGKAPGTANVASNPNGVSNAVTNVGANIASQVTTAMTGVPELGTAVSGAIKGKSPESIGISAAQSAVSREGVNQAVKAGIPSTVAAPAVGYIASTIGNVNKEMNAMNPNMSYGFAKAAPAAVGAMAGGLALGPIGAMIGGVLGGMFGNQSFENGVLGDMVDSRSHEGLLDQLEDDGMSRSDSASVRDTSAEMQGQYDPTGRDHYGMSDISMAGLYDDSVNVDTPENNGFTTDKTPGLSNTVAVNNVVDPSSSQGMSVGAGRDAPYGTQAGGLGGVTGDGDEW